MASSSSHCIFNAIILLVTLTKVIAGDIVFEDGYTVTTIIDGDKLNINPYSVFSLFGSSSDLIILDSVKSTFYTVSFSDSQVSEIKKLSGNGDAGYMDGDLGSAMFDKPKSFALDRKNNVYIADKANHVIRKISKTVVGSTTAWVIGVGVSCLIGLIIGFAIRPYVLPHEASGHQQFNKTWKHYLINLANQATTFYFVTKNAIASHNKLYHLLKKILTLSLYQLSLVFGLNMIRRNRKPPTPLKPISLLDCDDLQQPKPLKPMSFLDYDNVGHNETTKTYDVVDELKDLITFDGTLNHELCLEHENEARVEEKNEVFLEKGGKIDEHIYANFAGFVESSKRNSSVESWSIGS